MLQLYQFPCLDQKNIKIHLLPIHKYFVKKRMITIHCLNSYTAFYHFAVIHLVTFLSFSLFEFTPSVLQLFEQLQIQNFSIGKPGFLTLSLSWNLEIWWLTESIMDKAVTPYTNVHNCIKNGLWFLNMSISPKLVNNISLTPGWSGLERGITQGKFCATHRNLVNIICKQSENFVEGAIINYKVIFSLSMRLQIVANHPLSPVLSSLWYLGFTLLCNVVSVLIPFWHILLCYITTTTTTTIIFSDIWIHKNIESYLTICW